jgi:CRISPR/Cas system endoribonuclease Cas6 (RAMP superfamily)
MSAQMTKLIAAEMTSFFNAVREKFASGEEIEDQAEAFEALLQQHAKECAKKIEKKNQPKVKGKLTLYQIFCKKNRDTSLPFVEQNRALSAMWADMSEEDKQEFAEEAKNELEDDAKRFEKECEEGKEEGP